MAQFVPSHDHAVGGGVRKRPNLISYLTRCFFLSVRTGVEQRKTASG